MAVSVDDDFDEAMRDLDSFSSELVRIIESELDRLLRDMEAERVGDSSQADIEKMKRDGTSDNSRLNLGESLDALDSLRPLRPSPRPKKPLDIPKKALKDMAEPLVDIFDNETAVEVYVGLPGAQKEDVQVRVRDDRIDIKAGNLHKIIELRTKGIANHTSLSDYKNGVLKIIIPKVQRLRPKDVRRAKRV